jgi:hypothetical protein
MADLTDVTSFVGRNHGLAVISLVRRDGSPQASLVNAGVVDHPGSGEPVVGFVVRGASYKCRRLREHGFVAVTWTAGWEWIGVEGETDLFGPDDPLADVDAASLPQVLRDVFRGAGGTHDDWDAYDRVMLEERRTAVFVRPTRFLGR